MSSAELVSPANVAAFGRCVGGAWPHMSERDSDVWRAFTACCPLKVIESAYDVTLGGKAAAKHRGGDAVDVMWANLLKKRVDAALWTPEAVWCVEVKPVATMAALGQAVSYRQLWNAEGRSKEKARAMVVCARHDPDLVEVYRECLVTLLCVGGVASDERPWLSHAVLPAGSERLIALPPGTLVLA